METLSANSSFSEYIQDDDAEFLEALRNTVFPGEHIDDSGSLKHTRQESEIISLLTNNVQKEENTDLTDCEDRASPATGVYAPRKRLKRSTLPSPFSPTGKSDSKNLGLQQHSILELPPLHTSDPVSLADAARVPHYSPYQSNEHASRLMQDADFRAGHTSAAGGDFIEGFYRNSRLHHLSTWKEELKTLVAEAQERAERAFATCEVVNTGEGSAKMKKNDITRTSMGGNALQLLGSPNKGKTKEGEIDLDAVIMHCDFDCFFASVGLLTRPYLKDKPVVVCHSQGTQGGDKSTSEVSSANYKAREFGIRNGISLHAARKLCPAVVTIPYEFERYKAVSLQLYTILMSHADDLQAVSVDEALIDVTTAVKQLPVTAEKQNPAKDFAIILREEIKAKTGCDVSIGISHNITLARLATRKAKPAGVFHLHLADLQRHIEHLCIDELHGFGLAARTRALERLGAATLGELAKKPRAVLCDALGARAGADLYDVIRGVCRKKLESDKPRRSVSAEINYGIRFENNEQAQAFMFQLSEEVARRLDNIGMRGRSLTLKIMKRDPAAPIEPPKFLGHGCCQVFSRQAVLSDAHGRATSDALLIGQLAWRLLKGFAFDPKELRGIGIQTQKLEKAALAGDGARELGQAMLDFKAKKEPSNSQELSRSKKSSQPEVSVSVEPFSTDDNDDIVEVNPSTPPPQPGQASNLALPSFSQVDNVVFGALPTQIRQEIKSEYSRRSASPALSALGEHTNARSLSPPARGVRTNKGTPLSRITQALAPRTRAGDARSGASVALAEQARGNIFERCGKQKERQGRKVEVTRAELGRLGLDARVFGELPPEVQLEQLASARFARSFGRKG